MRTLINDIIDRIKLGVFGAAALLASFSVMAQSHYFDPEHPGHGVSVTQDGGQGSAFIWYTYNRDGEGRWLISTENCTGYPCEISLAQAFGEWMGGEVDLVTVGSAVVDFKDGYLLWEYDLRTWPEASDCGRMIWVVQTRCVGDFRMEAVD